jgi:hypothetical protein
MLSGLWRLFGFPYSFAKWFAFSRHLLSAVDLVAPRASICLPRNSAYALAILNNPTLDLLTDLIWLVTKPACRHDQ